MGGSGNDLVKRIFCIRHRFPYDILVFTEVVWLKKHPKIIVSFSEEGKTFNVIEKSTMDYHTIGVFYERIKSFVEYNPI